MRFAPLGRLTRTSLVSSVFALASCDHDECTSRHQSETGGCGARSSKVRCEVVASSKFATPSNLTVERRLLCTHASPHGSTVVAPFFARIGTHSTVGDGDPVRAMAVSPDRVVGTTRDAMDGEG